MVNNSHIQARLAKYPMTIILEFIGSLPPPDSTIYRFYKVKSLEGLPAQIWGLDAEDVLSQFDDFAKLLIFS